MPALQHVSDEVQYSTISKYILFEVVVDNLGKVAEAEVLPFFVYKVR